MPVIIDTDPPEHDRLRGLITRAFTPRRIAAMEPRITAIAEELVGGIAERRPRRPRRALRVAAAAERDRRDARPPRGGPGRLHRLSADWLALHQQRPGWSSSRGSAGQVELQRYFTAASRSGSRGRGTT